MDSDIAIRVTHISKTFKLPHEKHSSIKGALINFAGHKKGYEKQHVLDDINFEIKKGEFFGIVGRNGSGKSTLLKLLAGIYAPDKGSIEVNGKLTPFIELGVGFNPELTGRENVFLNGALLGFNRKEMTAMYDEIVEFAELKRFMDQKLKNYSSGMQVRLAFSIAIRANTDTLILDEVLAVGDAAFQQKCFDYFDTLKQGGKTVVLVTHDMGAVLKFCDRALLLDSGAVQSMAEPKQIADEYIEINYNEPVQSEAQEINGPHILAVEVSADHKVQTKYSSGDECELTVLFANPKKEKIHIGLQIFSNEGVYCFGTNTKINGLVPTTVTKGSITMKTKLNLVPGQYTVTAATMGAEGIKVYDYRPNMCQFRIRKDSQVEGVANLEQAWEDVKSV